MKFRAGELDAARATELARDSGFANIDTWGRFRDTDSCPDAGEVSLHALGKHVACTCGCGEQAPSGLEAAITAANTAMQQLWDAAQPVSEPVTAVAYMQPSGVAWWPDALMPQDWPLDSNFESILVADPYAVQGAGERFEGADAMALRALRVNASRRAQFVQSFPVRASDGAVNALLVRDELPEAFAKLSSFLR